MKAAPPPATSESADNRVRPKGQGYTVTSWSDSLPPIWLSIALTASGTRVATRQEHPLRGWTSVMLRLLHFLGFVRSGEARPIDPGRVSDAWLLHLRISHTDRFFG